MQCFERRDMSDDGFANVVITEEYEAAREAVVYFRHN